MDKEILKDIKSLSPIKKESNQKFEKNKSKSRITTEEMATPKNKLSKFNVKQKENANSKSISPDNKPDFIYEPGKENEVKIKEEKINKELPLRFPKNINEYRHIIDTLHISGDEVGWVLDLRTNRNKIKYEPFKGHHTQPHFYEKDFNKYKEKVEKEQIEKRKISSARGNLVEVNHLFKERLGGTANSSQFSFESTLRSFNLFPSIRGPSAPWRNLPNTEKPRIFSSYLPPMRPDSSRNIQKMEDLTIRPYISVYDVFYYLN